MRILLVEDNPKLAESIRRGLGEQGYSADVAHTGAEGLELAFVNEYDVVVLDRMLPDRDGIDVCRELRDREVTVPVLILSAISGTTDRVAGLDAGADDYLPKPFEFDELVARLRALLRRGQATESSTLRYADLELDLHKRTAHRGEEAVRLSGKEFALLEFLMRHPDRVLPRTLITEKVWDMNYEPTSNVVDVYISNLRRKLDRDHDAPLIHTVIGTGYRFGSPSE